jgi:molybdopterin synthase sulfur carrier subunit
MRINFYATLRQLVGGKTVEVQAPAASTTVLTALETVTRERQELAGELWRAPGMLKEHIHVFVNGREISFLNGLETSVTDRDTLDVFPPVGGGVAGDN